MQEDRKPDPPEIILRFLSWFCPDHLYEEIEGDLIQKFARDVKKFGEGRAKRRLIWNTIRFVRPGIIVRNKFSPVIKTIMIGNYFTVASRNILKRKLYSFINAFGLSIGIAFCLLIYLFIQDEKSFDQFHVNKHEIYRIDNRTFEFMEFKNGSKDPFGERETQHGKLGEAMVDELAEVQAMTRYFGPVGGLLRYQEKVFSETFKCVDSSFFKMLSFKLLNGSPDRIFRDKSEIVLTQKVAEKYFGDEDPIGKQMVIDVNGESVVTVAGIIEDAPTNSSISFEILIPLEKLSWYKSTWDNRSFPTFVQLLPGTDLASFEKNLNTLYKKYTGDGDRAFREREKIPEEFAMEELHATSLSDIHLDTKIKWENPAIPNIQ